MQSPQWHHFHSTHQQGFKMFQKFIAAEKAVSMSLAVLATGLTFGGIAQIADSEYSRVEQTVKVESQQQVAASKMTTRSGALNA
jgi:hypothetical protein